MIASSALSKPTLAAAPSLSTEISLVPLMQHIWPRFSAISKDTCSSQTITYTPIASGCYASTNIALKLYWRCAILHPITWEVEYTNEFENWWNNLSADEQESVAVSVRLLELRGPSLPFPYSSGIHGSSYGHMRELRIQHQGRPYRVLFAFDPRRVAILLIGGDKTGNDRWYAEYVPIADRLYDEHLQTLGKEGLG